MLHLVRRRWNQLRLDDEVKLKGDGGTWRVIEKTGGANFVVEQRDDLEFPTTREVVWSEDYEGHLVTTGACEDRLAEMGLTEYYERVLFREGWSECERHYGIPLEPERDPIKALALAILRGDPQACDAARDVIRC